MKRKSVSSISILAGIVMVLLSLLADVIGIGTYPGFNNVQLAGILVGVAFVIIGIILKRLKPKVKKPNTR